MDFLRGLFDSNQKPDVVSSATMLRHDVFVIAGQQVVRHRRIVVIDSATFCVRFAYGLIIVIVIIFNDVWEF